ncbi:MAG: type I restriction enzyme HsdR N-terminal domain-containing protein [Bacteroidales bacterium]|jgi:predicted type IV restriction endonuclease|nr:type I restriction enzyme HsdR N-terminal domain-containing protein [Bacteroidales bacterium]
MNIPAKFAKRINENLKKYQGIIAQIKKKDANESDTVTVITDILQDIFGYDKYSDITSEYAIKGTYCDLAILDVHKKIGFLIEVKAISVALNDNHIKQALDYGANAGVNWVLLTNAETWMLYKIKFGKPIDKELVSEFDLLTINPKSDKELEALFVISKDGQDKSIIEDFYLSIQVKNKFIIGCLLNSEEVYSLIRRTMKKLFADVKISEQEIADIMVNDIIKREIIDSEESKKAKKDIDKIYKKLERAKERSSLTSGDSNVPKQEEKVDAPPVQENSGVEGVENDDIIASSAITETN